MIYLQVSFQFCQILPKSFKNCFLKSKNAISEDLYHAFNHHRESEMKKKIQWNEKFEIIAPSLLRATCSPIT